MSLFDQNLTFPDLVETQRNSFRRFLERGIGEELLAISTIQGDRARRLHKQKLRKPHPAKNPPIVPYLDKRLTKETVENRDFTIEFKTNDYYFKRPKHTPESAVANVGSYDAALIVPAVIRFPLLRLSKYVPVKFCNLPLMSSSGNFVVNGSPRVVVHQMVRSPGVYLKRQTDAKNRDTFTVSFLASYGSWLRLDTRVETGPRADHILYAKIDNLRPIPVTLLLQAIGFSYDDVLDVVHDPMLLMDSREAVCWTHSRNDALTTMMGFFFPTTPVTVQSGKKFLYDTFFNPRRYSFGRVGRKQVKRKLRLTRETDYLTLTPEDLLAGVDCLVRLKAGQTHLLDDIDHLKNRRIRLSGELIQTQFRMAVNRLERVVKARINDPALAASFLRSDDREDAENVRFMRKIKKLQRKESKKVDNSPGRLSRKMKPTAKTDTRTSTQKIRRKVYLKTVSNHARWGSFVRTTIISTTMREFFGSSQLSQFMDQTNPLAEVTHKRRLSSLGPGGLHRDRAGLIVRGIHPSYYGRVCPIETPEGKNAGLVGSLASFAQINADGFVMAPYYKMQKEHIVPDTKGFFLLTACYEDQSVLASGDVNLKNPRVSTRLQRAFTEHVPQKIDFLGLCPIQFMSIATALIPFLEHDDANRALMGSNMQRQAVSLLRSERPFVGTGLESRIAHDSGTLVIAEQTGYVIYADAERIDYMAFDPERARDYLNPERVTVKLEPYHRSNQDSCLHHRPLVKENTWVQRGDCLADNTATFGGELALGRNIFVGYMPWEGYNFEDAVLVSERLVFDDLFTSIHIERYDVATNRATDGQDYFTRAVADNEYLDKFGVVKAGTWVESGDVLVGKVSPQKDSETTPEQKLLRAIFGGTPRQVKETPFCVSHGVSGRILDRRCTYTTQKLNASEGAFQSTGHVFIYVVQKRRLQIGDKVAGRHGNKGIISNILPRADMPFVQSGQPLDMVLNPLGVPSRMNVGQIFECLLGLAAHTLEKNFKVMPFDEMHGDEISRGFVYQYLYEARLMTQQKWIFRPSAPGKTIVFDGRTGLPFEQPVTVGYPYILKLVHLVDDKIHARSTGPYSLVTQQPLGGRSKHGGQRLGEMEVWALEGFGAAYTLQELLTIKSDDMLGRTDAFMAMIRGTLLPKPGIPESFKVLVSELRGLCLDMTLSQIR